MYLENDMHLDITARAGAKPNMTMGYSDVMTSLSLLSQLKGEREPAMRLECVHLAMEVD